VTLRRDAADSNVPNVSPVASFAGIPVVTGHGEPWPLNVEAEDTSAQHPV
jgi:hypothetical protein